MVDCVLIYYGLVCAHTRCAVGGLRPVYYGPGVSSLLDYNSGGSKLVIGNHLSFTDTFLLNGMAYLAGAVHAITCCCLLPG